MLKFAAGAGAALLLVLSGFFIWQSVAQRDPGLTVPDYFTSEIAVQDEEGGDEGPAVPPAADARTKEQRRFDRADKDKNGAIALEELYMPRRRAFARLDRNGDGRLAFEEWAVRTSTRFAEADRNRDRQLTREEYATTAPRRRAPSRNKANCAC
jgi:hypothetical protein